MGVLFVDSLEENCKEWVAWLEHDFSHYTNFISDVSRYTHRVEVLTEHLRKKLLLSNEPVLNITPIVADGEKINMTVTNAKKFFWTTISEVVISTMLIGGLVLSWKKNYYATSTIILLAIVCNWTSYFLPNTQNNGDKHETTQTYSNTMVPTEEVLECLTCLDELEAALLTLRRVFLKLRHEQIRFVLQGKICGKEAGKLERLTWECKNCSNFISGITLSKQMLILSNRFSAIPPLVPTISNHPVETTSTTAGSETLCGDEQTAFEL